MREKVDGPLELVAGIYEAALQPALWGQVLASVQEALGADSASLYLEDLKAQDAPFEISHDLDRSRLPDYYQHFYQIDPSFQFRMRRPVGTLVPSHRILPDPQFEKSEFYQDFFRHLDRFYTMGGLITRDHWQVGVFSLQRTRRSGAFGEDERARLLSLFPHLQRAFQIGRQLASAEAERHAMLALLERIPTGVILLDERRRVVFLNRRAEAILAAGDGLLMAPQGLQAFTPDVQAELERLIAEAVAAGAGRGAYSGGALTLPTVAGRDSYQVLVTPLRMERLRVELGRERICAAVFLQLRDSKPALSMEVLRDLFGLTTAEARVALALVNGRTPDEIATRTHTSRYTVRAQLSSIYEKLGVRRQAEAVQRMLTSPAVLDNRKPRGGGSDD